LVISPSYGKPHRSQKGGLIIRIPPERARQRSQTYPASGIARSLSQIWHKCGYKNPRTASIQLFIGIAAPQFIS
jgi:hypothetical protein